MFPVIVVLTAALCMLIVEARWRASCDPQRKHWWLRAIALTTLQAGIAFLATLNWEQALALHPLFDAGDLSVASGGILGYFVLTFVYYWWHRARHESPWLWRTLHQLHHSAARIELITSFYKHPLEILANGLLSALVLFALLGLPPAAAVFATTLSGLAELFYHWNVPTPYWLGYLFQRPEMHRVHHQRHRHRNNYSDLPLWDMLFGTFENPRRAPASCGFDEHRELDLVAMLMAHDVHATSQSSGPKRDFV